MWLISEISRVTIVLDWTHEHLRYKDLLSGHHECHAAVNADFALAVAYILYYAMDTTAKGT